MTFIPGVGWIIVQLPDTFCPGDSDDLADIGNDLPEPAQIEYNGPDMPVRDAPDWGDDLVYMFEPELFDGPDMPWDNNPLAIMSAPYNRPSGFRDGVRDKVWENAKDKNGIVRDPYTGEIINKDDDWEMGHAPGYEFWKLQEYARKNKLSREEFLDLYNDPKRYRPETPGTNRSHILEDDINDLYEQDDDDLVGAT